MRMPAPNRFRFWCRGRGKESRGLIEKAADQDSGGQPPILSATVTYARATMSSTSLLGSPNFQRAISRCNPSRQTRSPGSAIIFA